MRLPLVAGSLHVSTLHGSCLCGVVAFAVDGRYSEIDHCHCWKCRKVSGSNSNAVLLTSSRSLRWERGAEFVKTYRMDDGWQSVFCAACGSPLPLLGADGKLYWVPAGSLDDDPGVGVAQHIHVQGKGSWEVIGGDAPQFDHEPPPAPPSESGR